jgi:hypothetical protein
MNRFEAVVLSGYLLLAGSCVLRFSYLIYDSTRPPEIGENVQSVDWLPNEATNIYYYRKPAFGAYEFKISEAGFREWAETSAFSSSEYHFYQPVVDLMDIEDKSTTQIMRYSEFISPKDDSVEQHEKLEHREPTYINITNGLYGTLIFGNGGGYSIGYDRDTGTAYWEFTPR